MESTGRWLFFCIWTLLSVGALLFLYQVNLESQRQYPGMAASVFSTSNMLITATINLLPLVFLSPFIGVAIGRTMQQPRLRQFMCVLIASLIMSIFFVAWITILTQIRSKNGGIFEQDTGVYAQLFLIIPAVFFGVFSLINGIAIFLLHAVYRRLRRYTMAQSDSSSKPTAQDLENE